MSAEYAFTDWKGVDWDALYAAYIRQIETAQKPDDFNAYYRVMRKYINAIPDGHVRITNLSEIGAGSPGLILDIRNNDGGLDDMAAAILGSFYAQGTFYEYQNVYDPQTGTRSPFTARTALSV